MSTRRDTLDRPRRGPDSLGTPIATVSGNYVYPGAKGQTAPVATLDGDTAYRGNNPTGVPIATVRDGNKMDTAMAAVYFLLL